MSAIGSLLRRRWPELAWGLFATAMLGVLLALADFETVPFHFVWVSLTLLYGLRPWSFRSTVAVLAVVCAATGAGLALAVSRGRATADELAEVPLMAAMFLAMVWHARHRQAALDEARRMAERERRMLQRQREFLRYASHELKTPITVARGHAELIRQTSADSQAAEDARVVLDELARLSSLSERLLLLAAADHPGFLSPRPVRAEGLVEEAERRWRTTAPRAWEFVAGTRGTVPADPGRLAAALDALVENAVEFTAPGDLVRVAARREGDRLVLEVADGGVGIPSHRLPQLFEPFARADDGRARARGGTGLGLAIVRAIALAHGGSVEAESEPGRGSVFRIRLPGFRPDGLAGGRVAPRDVPAALA